MSARDFEIVVVGAGPAGIAAAVRAAEGGSSVLVIDDNPAAGGQIWRGENKSPWFRAFERCGAKLLSGSRVIDASATHRFLVVETQDQAFEVRFSKLIIATGARELFLPFPGWTLPNVMGVGGLQALAKSGLPLRGKRIVVAGSGPLLLAAAAYFRTHGATVPVIAEQADASRVFGFAMRLATNPAKLWQAARLINTARARYLKGCWVDQADGDDRVKRVRLRTKSRTWYEQCDYLAIGYGLLPNTELPELLQCDPTAVNEFQETSSSGIYCAGECTGIGGVDLSIAEGEIAGYAATGRSDLSRRIFGRRARARRFAKALEDAFAFA